MNIQYFRRKAGNKIPILMYHSVSDSSRFDLLPVECRPIGYRLTVSQFEKHLLFLKENNCAPISLNQLLNCREKKISPPPRAVIITFDDGYQDNYRDVLPRLREFNFCASFFLAVSLIGREGMMGWRETEKLLQAGMEVGSHGMNHDLLAGKKEEELVRELEESRRGLEKELKTEISFFSLPRGYLPPGFPRLARRAGYQGMCTSIAGYNSIDTDPFGWKRFPIRTGFGTEHLQAIIRQKGYLLSKILIEEKIRTALRNRYRWRQ